MEILALHEPTIDHVEARLHRFMDAIGPAAETKPGRLDSRRERGRTVVRSSSGVRGSVYHASGAMRVSFGHGPMDHLYERIPDREVLARETEDMAARIGLDAWVRGEEALTFEQVWQIKAGAASRHGVPVDAVL